VKEGGPFCVTGELALERRSSSTPSDVIKKEVKRPVSVLNEKDPESGEPFPEKFRS